MRNSGVRIYAWTKIIEQFFLCGY